MNNTWYNLVFTVPKREEVMFFMEEALRYAQIARSKNEIPVGCVIVKENSIVVKTHNLMHSQKNPLQHAEMIALNNVTKKGITLSQCDMYVTLEPCSMCLHALYLCKVRRVFFGAYSNAMYNNLVYRKMIGGILENDCGDLLRSFCCDMRNK